MCKNLTVSMLFFLMFLADVLLFSQTFPHCRNYALPVNCENLTILPFIQIGLGILLSVGSVSLFCKFISKRRNILFK